MSILIRDSLDIESPQKLIKAFLNSLPEDLDLSQNGCSISNFNANSLFDLQSSTECTTPLRVRQQHDERIEPSTPSLSLPDSFGIDEESLVKKVDYKNNLKTTKCYRCQKLRHTYMQEKETMRLEYSKNIKDIQSECDRQSASLKNTISTREECHRLEVQSMEDRIHRLNSTLDAECVTRRQCELKATLYDKVSEELSSSKIQVEEFRSALESQRAALTAVSASELAARNTADDATRLRDLLALDKAFLQQELKNVEGRLEERSRAFEASTTKTVALELKVSQLTDQLLTLQLNARNGFDERMEREIMRLREDSSKEMETMKSTSRDITDRENRVLREAKVSLENECNQLRRRNDMLTLDLNALQREISIVNSEKNSEISEIRGLLTIKSYEVTANGIKYEEVQNLLRQKELLLDVQQQELNVHKQAMLRLENESHHRIAGLETELDKAGARLRAYEVLEEEIDHAVMRTADGNIVGTTAEIERDACASLVDVNTKKLMMSVKGIPCSSERRVKQAVYLAQRLLETERQRDELKERVRELQSEGAKAALVISKLEKEVQCTDQPTSYLIAKYRDEEEAKLKLMQAHAALQQDLNTRRLSEATAKQESQQLRERLRLLLEQRGELETVKCMLQQMCELNMAPPLYDSKSDDEDKEDEDGDFSFRETSTQAWKRHDQVQMAANAGSNSHSNQYPHRNLQVLPSPSACIESPEKVREVDTVCATLGLSPETVHNMTSPPKHSSSYQQHKQCNTKLSKEIRHLQQSTSDL